MAITFVVNTGSTSKKYALFCKDEPVFSIRFEETGDGFRICRTIHTEQQKCESIPAHIYKKAIAFFIADAIKMGVINSSKDIERVGMRIVAPGTYFTVHKKIDSDYLKKLEDIISVAPLHIPAILTEINEIKALITKAVIFGISDSAFHTSIPTYRRELAINKNDAKNYDIHRFGYHGLSMASIVRRSDIFFGASPDRIVACHIGGGVSITALHHTKSVDTSMGYSPASGVMMGSRAGNLNADALIALMVKKSIKDADTLTEYVNVQSGFKGITGYSDLRLVLNQYMSDNPDASEALQMFRYQIHRQIGGHVALLGGLDALIFTGTAVIRNSFLRAFLLEGLSGFDLEVDTDKNDALVGGEGFIHFDRSAVSIAVIKNDEMGEINKLVQKIMIS